jgi:hypothetical protein
MRITTDSILLLQAALMLDMDILERRVEDMDWDGRRIHEARSHR